MYCLYRCLCIVYTGVCVLSIQVSVYCLYRCLCIVYTGVCVLSIQVSVYCLYRCLCIVYTGSCDYLLPCVLSMQVSVAIINLKPSFEYETVPKLVAHAFMKAKVKNTSQYALLQGPANVFLDNNFISKVCRVEHFLESIEAI